MGATPLPKGGRGALCFQGMMLGMYVWGHLGGAGPESPMPPPPPELQWNPGPFCSLIPKRDKKAPSEAIFSEKRWA